ncbi:ABC transporter permease [Endothiovibrio diazotrophicus]
MQRHASPLPTLAFVAWRNVWRNPVRSLLTISALAGGLAIMILYASLLEGMARDMVRYATELNTGHLQVQRRAFIDDRDLYATLPDDWLGALEKELPGAHFAPRLYAAGLASAAESSAGVLIEAVDPARERQTTRMLDHLRRGEARLDVADVTARGLTRYNVVIGAQLAKNMRLHPGDELVLVTQAADGSVGNALYRVAGVLRPLEPAFDRMGVLLSIEAYRELMYLEQGYHELAVRLDDPDRLESAQATIDGALHALAQREPLDELGGPAVVRNWRQINPAVADLLGLSGAMNLIVGLIVVGLASLGMLNTLMMAIHERTREFGILLAIGMKRRWLLLAVVLESLYLALVAAAAGTLLGLLGAHWLATRGIDFSATMPDGYDWGGMVFEPVMKGHLLAGDVVNAGLLMIAVTLLASLIPAWRTVRMRPAEAMR